MWVDQQDITIVGYSENISLLMNTVYWK